MFLAAISASADALTLRCQWDQGGAEDLQRSLLLVREAVLERSLFCWRGGEADFARRPGEKEGLRPALFTLGVDGGCLCGIGDDVVASGSARVLVPTGVNGGVEVRKRHCWTSALVLVWLVLALVVLMSSPLPASEEPNIVGTPEIAQPCRLEAKMLLARMLTSW